MNGTPVFRASVSSLNNHGAIEFDGVNESVQTATYNPPDQPLTIMAVVVPDSSSATRTIVDARTVGSRNGVQLSTSDELQLVNVGGTVGTGLTVTDAAASLVTGYLNGSSSFGTVNGTPSSTVSTGSTGNASGWTIGTAYNGANDYPGKVAIAGTYAGDLISDGQWSTFKAWVASYYGITVS